MEQEVRKTALNYGVILGVIYALVTTLMYAIDLSLFTNLWLGIFLFVFIVVFAIFSTAKIKKMLSGVMTYKQAFMSYIIPIIVGLGINSLLVILLLNVVDADAKEIITENTVEMTQSMMERFGANESDIDVALEQIREKDNFSPLNILKSYLSGLIFHSVIGLLVALFFKTRRPD